MVIPIREFPRIPCPRSRPRPRFVPALATLAVLGAAAVAGPPPLPSSPPALEVDFSPGVPGMLRARIAREIRGARESMDVALYTGDKTWFKKIASWLNKKLGLFTKDY